MEDKRCSECKCPTARERIKMEEEMRGRKLPGTPVIPAGTLHHSWCPTLPHLSREEQEQLQHDLDEIARCHRRARAEAQNYIIG